VWWFGALVLATIFVLPLLAGFAAPRRWPYHLVLLFGGVPSVLYWVQVGLVDPSYDLSPLGQLLIPGFYAVCIWAIWCTCAYVGSVIRKGFDRGFSR
jgi:hypothetical protein